LGIAVIVAPAVALLGGGSATAARTGGSSRQIPESLLNSVSPEMNRDERRFLDFLMTNLTFPRLVNQISVYLRSSPVELDFQNAF
jgi:hypothetical protein